MGGALSRMCGASLEYVNMLELGHGIKKNGENSHLSALFLLKFHQHEYCLQGNSSLL